MREDPRVRWVVGTERAEPVVELAAELGVSSAMLGSLLAEAAAHAAAEERAWAERAQGAEGVSMEERVALLG